MEILNNNYACANLIRTGKIEQIYSQLQTKTRNKPDEKMITLEKHLSILVKDEQDRPARSPEMGQRPQGLRGLHAAGLRRSKQIQMTQIKAAILTLAVGQCKGPVGSKGGTKRRAGLHVLKGRCHGGVHLLIASGVFSSVRVTTRPRVMWRQKARYSCSSCSRSGPM